MAELMSLHDAVATHVRDGQTVALEGFTHLIPFAAGHEVLRQGRRDLTLVRMTPDLLYDQMIGMGCAARVVFSFAGNPGVGSLRRMRDAVEHGWPHPIELVEHSHAAMAAAWDAGAAGLPFAMLRHGYAGSGLREVNPDIRSVTCPFTGEELAAVPALTPDVGIVHAQRADRRGNVLVEGIIGVQKQVVLASAVSIVTVEEVVDDLAAPSLNSCIIPGWAIDAVCVARDGAHPSYTHGYYDRDNAFYTAWDDIAADRDRFLEWMEANVLQAAPA